MVSSKFFKGILIPGLLILAASLTAGLFFQSLLQVGEFWNGFLAASLLTFIMGFVLYLAWRICRLGLYYGYRAKDPFSGLLAIGCSTVWTVQLLLHTGGVIKLIPMTGVPFPGISSGGTALLVFSTLAGWIMAVSESDSPASAGP